MPRILLINAFLSLLFISCDRTDRNDIDAPEPEPEYLQLASLFASDEPYTSLKLDSASLERSLADLSAHVQDPQRIREFYERRDHQFAWFVNDSLSGFAGPFLSLINSNDTIHRTIASLGDDLVRIVRDPKKKKVIAGLDVLMTAKFQQLAGKKFERRSEKRLKDLNWYIPENKRDLHRWVDSIVSGKMDLEELVPVHPQYALLEEQLKRYASLTDHPWPEITLQGKKSLKPGQQHPSIPAIRERLHLLGDLGSEGDTIHDPSTTYDPEMAAAVSRFQLRHGMKDDAVIGSGCLDALNITPFDRMITVLVNMERLRWMPEEFGQPFLAINIPDYKLKLIEDDKVAMEMEVVVGTSADRTVIFSDTITYLVFSPTWTLPESIVKDEILPEIEKNEDYLEEKNMEVVGGTEEKPIIRQLPGPDNALGRVKFMFPNSYSIYLHDTPAKGLFSREERAFSHGCIRVSRPKDLALYLLKDDEEWTEERIEAAMDSTEEVEVGLKKKIPVIITYFTAWVDNGGSLQLRNDIYGHDKRLAEELFWIRNEPEGIANVPTDRSDR